MRSLCFASARCHRVNEFLSFRISGSRRNLIFATFSVRWWAWAENVTEKSTWNGSTQVHTMSFMYAALTTDDDRAEVFDRICLHKAISDIIWNGRTSRTQNSQSPKTNTNLQNACINLSSICNVRQGVTMLKRTTRAYTHIRTRDRILWIIVWNKMPKKWLRQRWQQMAMVKMFTDL